MIHIAVIDDEEQARENIKKCLAAAASKLNAEFNVSEFSSGLSFLGDYRPIYDVVLMDIEMPDADGLEIAHKLRKVDTSVLLIFVTNMSQFAIRGYEVDALDFIVKPVNEYTLAMKLNRAIARTTKRTDDSVQIRNGGEVYGVQTASIKYLEVSGHYVVYHTTDGDFSEYITLKNAEKKINKSFFVRCNRCYLVNLRYVESIKKDYVIIGKDKLLISYPQKKAFLSAFSEFLGGGRK